MYIYHYPKVIWSFELCLLFWDVLGKEAEKQSTCITESFFRSVSFNFHSVQQLLGALFLCAVLMIIAVVLVCVKGNFFNTYNFTMVSRNNDDDDDDDNNVDADDDNDDNYYI